MKDIVKVRLVLGWWLPLLLIGLLGWTSLRHDSTALAQEDPRGSRGSSIVWVDGEVDEDLWIGRIERDTANRSDYRYWKGLIQVLEGDPAQGAQLMESVMPEVESDRPEVHLYLGVAYSKLRRNEAMCDALRQYLVRVRNQNDLPSSQSHRDVEERIEDRCR